MKDSLRDVYDGFAATYEKNRGLFDISEILHSFYSRLGRQEGSMLDLGCGSGEPVARYFVDRHWTVTGVDFSERMLELASKYVPEMRRIHADIRSAEFDSDAFDAIVASYCLFHIPANDHAELFQRLHKWLRPGGKALFTYATEEYTGSEEFDGHKEFMGQELYYSHKAPDTLYADLENTGFTIDSRDYRDIGGETFLWVTVSRPRQQQ